MVFLGAQYVVPIAYDGTAFTALQPFAVFRYHKDAVMLAEQDISLARNAAHGSSNDGAIVFAKAVPDPVAVLYRTLLPTARLAAVIAARKPR